MASGRDVMLDRARRNAAASVWRALLDATAILVEATVTARSASPVWRKAVNGVVSA
jgi:hypothetical protein